MSIRTGLYQGTQLKQEMKINPRLYQAMDLLYMPLLDLQQHIKQEMLNNPFLDLEEPQVTEEEITPSEKEKEKEEKEKAEEIDWEEILLDGFEAGGRRQEYEEKEYFEPVSVESRDLYDHLRDQLVLLRLSPRQVLLGEEIIGNIDENGYLTCSLEEVVKGLNLWLEDAGADWAEEEGGEAVPFTLEDGEEMLRILQAFDPAGIGARDLRECLVLQLQDFEMEDTLAYRIVREYFDQLINHRWSEISKDLSITPKDVQTAADEIAKLDPKPGLKYSAPPDNYITPDLIVEKIDGEYLVFLNDTSLPRLKLSRAYREIAKDKSKFKGENKEFISNKLNSANWMIQAIEQRRQTMLKVMNFIVDRQREFFEKGVQYLKPLTLREVAEVINMHESTVSRVTNEKFVQTPRGVLPLKFFFSSGLSTTSGEDVSARGIKAKIQKLVSDEEAKRPLTDQAIVNILKDEGIQIARRTVAKYRDQLGILSARMRKRV
ncbi:MAG TPA: RNA polymerase factor sigma-54 [Longimicrobiales bacterium]|nr:RNA polymerase factor sigma-54 [Longimicrobiales bacterium]